MEGRTGEGDGGRGEATIRLGRVIKLAVRSRLLVFSLFLVWRTLASPYDTSASLNPPCLGATPGDSEWPSFVESQPLFTILDEF